MNLINRHHRHNNAIGKPLQRYFEMSKFWRFCCNLEVE